MRSKTRNSVCLLCAFWLGGTWSSGAAAADPGEALRALLSACDASRPESVGKFVRELGKLASSSSRAEGDRRALVVALLATLNSETPREIQVLLIREIGRLGKYEAVKPLGRVLSDQTADLYVREEARRALEAIPVVTVKRAFRDALGKAQGALKIGILRSMGIRRDSLAVEHMLEAVRDPDIEVRLAAIEAMALVGEISSVGVLEEALGQYEGVALLRVRRAYLRLADSLVDNAERGTARRIYDRAMSLGTAERCAALVGFARAGLQSEVQRIAGLTTSEEVQLRGAALEAALIMPGPNMTEALETVLAEAKDAKVREGLERVLARREGKKR